MLGWLVGGYCWGMLLGDVLASVSRSLFNRGVWCLYRHGCALSASWWYITTTSIHLNHQKSHLGSISRSFFNLIKTLISLFQPILHSIASEWCLTGGRLSTQGWAVAVCCTLRLLVLVMVVNGCVPIMCHHLLTKTHLFALFQDECSGMPHRDGFWWWACRFDAWFGGGDGSTGDVGWLHEGWDVGPR